MFTSVTIFTIIRFLCDNDVFYHIFPAYIIKGPAPYPCNNVSHISSRFWNKCIRCYCVMFHRVIRFGLYIFYLYILFSISFIMVKRSLTFIGLWPVNITRSFTDSSLLRISALACAASSTLIYSLISLPSPDILSFPRSLLG